MLYTIGGSFVSCLRVVRGGLRVGAKLSPRLARVVPFTKAARSGPRIGQKLRNPGASEIVDNGRANTIIGTEAGQTARRL